MQNFGPIIVELDQHRNHSASGMKVLYETATVTRTYEYVHKGETKTNRLTVNVYAETGSVMNDVPTHYTVNWSALGSVSILECEAYLEMIQKASEVASQLTKAYCPAVAHPSTR